jgi:hypothetical protein
MRRTALAVTAAIALATSAGLGFQTAPDGPYKVLKTAKVGGEGGTDYIFADAAGRRLYITRGATQAQPATDTRPEVPAFGKRLTIFDLDTLEPIGTIAGVGGNGATVCPKTGHGFTSDHPQPSMFDVKTMKLIKTIEVPAGFSADGIYCDASNDRVYIGSHPTKTMMVVDAATGNVLGHIDLGGTPEQTIGAGNARRTRKRRTAADTRSQCQAAADVCHPAREGRKDSLGAAACRRIRRHRVQPDDHGGLQHARQWHDDHRQGKEPDKF